MFGKKKREMTLIPYDPQTMKAVLRCSICTGEQVAGFKELATGKFTEVMLIKDNRQLQDFMKMYGLTNVSKEY